MKSWRTNLSAVAVIIGIVINHFWPEHGDLVNKIMAAAVAYGLLAARDNRVTSEDVKAK